MNALKCMAVTAVCVMLFSGCTQEMMDEARYEPLEKTDEFVDQSSARPKVEGTVAQGQLKIDEGLHYGKENGQYVEAFPYPLTGELLTRGRERFDIFCAVCHDRTGSGRGMVVQRGFTPPPSLHVARVREAPLGYLYHVVREGKRNMPGYAHQIPLKDRWAIVAYVRALQLSQHASLGDVPHDERESLAAPGSHGEDP